MALQLCFSQQPPPASLQITPVQEVVSPITTVQSTSQFYASVNRSFKAPTGAITTTPKKISYYSHY